MSRDLVGVTLGKYRCVEFIGHGGMAEVYRAIDVELERIVAVKVLHPFLVSEDGFVDRFRREARTLASLQHPNIVSIFDSGLQDFNSYVVMEYVPGPTLKDRLRELGARGEHMPIAEVRRILAALIAALRYAHRAGIVHRDLKPTNVILADDGRVVLTDFGLAKIVGSSVHTASMAMIGTPAYMAPEQAQAGAVDPRSDIYALSVSLFEMLTGRLPFEAETPFAMIAKHSQESLPRASQLRRDLPRGLDQVILKATAKSPDDRFQTIDQFADALDAAFEGRRLPFRIRRPRASRDWLALAGVVLLLSLLGIAAAQGWFAASPPPPTPTTTPSPTATPRILRARIIGPVDLHEQPDRSSRVVGRLERGAEVALLDQNGSWWHVRALAGGLTGWVMDENLVFILPTATPTPSNTPPPGASLTPTPPPTATPRPTATPTPTASLTPTLEPGPGGGSPGPGTPTSTAPGVGATATPSRAPTLTPPPTATPAPTDTRTPTAPPAPTLTHTPTRTPVPSITPTPTNTPRIPPTVE
jgi:serine/threonine-protein kinase